MAQCVLESASNRLIVMLRGSIFAPLSLSLFVSRVHWSLELFILVADKAYGIFPLSQKRAEKQVGLKGSQTVTGGAAFLRLFPISRSVCRP